MGTCYIVSAGDMTQPFPQTQKDDLVIAADGGYLHLQANGIEPDILLGDFDSMPLPEDKQALVYPTKKDDTDTMIAIKVGMEKGYNEFVIYGGLGGERTDHSIANLQALGFIAEHSGRGTLVGNGEYFTIIRDGEIVLNAGKNKTFSVFAFGAKAEGVTIEGAAYNVENVDFSPYFPNGVSNEFKEKIVRISVKKGCLLIVYNK